MNALNVQLTGSLTRSHNQAMRKSVFLILIFSFLCFSCSTSMRQAGKLTDAERQRIVQVAEKYIGVPYEWGGQGFWWEDGATVDCSGFVINVYKEALVDRSLPFEDSTVMEIYTRWSSPCSAPAAGDLVFMGDGTDGDPSHIGIVLAVEGDCLEFIDASSLPGIMGVSIRSYPLDNPKILSFGHMMLF